MAAPSSARRSLQRDAVVTDCAGMVRRDPRLGRSRLREAHHVWLGLDGPGTAAATSSTWPAPQEVEACEPAYLPFSPLCLARLAVDSYDGGRLIQCATPP